MNEPLFNATTHQISLLYEAWMNNEISTSDWAEHSHRLNQQLLESVRSAPAIADNSCHGCRHFYGKTYGGNTLVCGMHPTGVDGDCPDREEGDQYQRKLDVQRNDEWVSVRVTIDNIDGMTEIRSTCEVNPYQRLTRSRTFKRVNGRRIMESEEVRSVTEKELWEFFQPRLEHIPDGAMDALAYVLGSRDS